VIIGGGGHGLATAYYLAKEHGITNLAVIEKGYLGGGNTARNTTFVRSNYLWDEASHLYEHSLKLWECLAQELNYNWMISQRGGLILAKKNDELAKKLNSAVFPAGQGGPLMHVIAAKAISFKEALSDGFVEYQQQVIDNAREMAKVFQSRGYNVVSGGTDNHLFLLDLIDKGMTGKDADAALGRANITVNKNSVPNDPQSPFVTSGLRIGTPAITSRGFGLNDVAQLTGWICDVLDDIDNEETITDVRNKVLGLCDKNPVYR
jgi:glycine/serine hydroxymethyltransferase